MTNIYKLEFPHVFEKNVCILNLKNVRRPLFQPENHLVERLWY